MGKDSKKPKVKGYGAHWTGDIKNKHIKRKNKQYIRDQKYLHIYKKLKDFDKQEEGYQKLENNSVLSNNLTNDSESVHLIKPQIETTYLSHSEDDGFLNTPESEVDQVESNHEVPTSTNYNTQSSKGKKGDPYSKVLKKRKEIEKLKKEAYNQRVEEIKKKKKEIRDKKRKRYDRHRLLGAKTKKGQPIMKNVIKHLMRNFKPD